MSLLPHIEDQIRADYEPDYDLDRPTRAEAEEDAGPLGYDVGGPLVDALRRAIARDIDDPGPDHDLSSCACWECDQIRDEEEAERVADGRRDDAVH